MESRFRELEVNKLRLLLYNDILGLHTSALLEQSNTTHNLTKYILIIYTHNIRFFLFLNSR